MRIGAVIQARMGSTRLPGKVLMDLHGKPVLGHVLERAMAVTGIDTVMVATTVHDRDNPIVEYCRRWQVPCYRGSEDDVLDRYYRASVLDRLQVVIRITADCPLLDPRVVERVLAEFVSSGADYCSNVHPPTYPDGLDVEIMRIEALERAWCEAADPFEREHVTPYIWRRSITTDEHGFILHNVAADMDLSALRWTVDTHADLEQVRQLLVCSYDYRKLLWKGGE